MCGYHEFFVLESNGVCGDVLSAYGRQREMGIIYSCVLVCFFVFSYYSVIAGWTVGYIFTEIVNIPVDFEVFQQTPMYVIPLTWLFILMTILIVLGGVSGGIEKASKFLMPVLLSIIICIAGRSVTLECS